MDHWTGKRGIRKEQSHRNKRGRVSRQIEQSAVSSARDIIEGE